MIRDLNAGFINAYTDYTYKIRELSNGFKGAVKRRKTKFVIRLPEGHAQVYHIAVLDFIDGLKTRGLKFRIRDESDYGSSKTNPSRRVLQSTSSSSSRRR